MNLPDYYEFLQISPNAEFDTIHRVHRFLALRFHPGDYLGIDAHPCVDHRPLLTAVDQPDAAPVLLWTVFVEQPDELVGGVDRIRWNSQ